MGKGNAARTILGMIFQLIGLCLLIGELMSPSDRLLAGFGLGAFAVGFVIYADKNLSALKYLRDWIGCFFILLACCSVTAFLLMLQGDAEFPASLISFVLSGLISYVLLKLFLWVNTKYAASKKAAAPKKTAAVRTAPTKAHAPVTAATQSAAPAQKKEDSIEAQIAALAAKLKEVPAPPAIQEKRRAPARSQEELYNLIDAEAEELPPDEAACYTSEGQALLMKTVARVLPQMEMLCAPGFPGDRLLNAADGAQAYDAMVDLVGSIRDLLKSFSRSQLQETLSGVSQEDALLTWKAFRFYAKIMGGEDEFEEIFCLLSDKV